MMTEQKQPSVPREAVEMIWAFFDALMGEDPLSLLATLEPESDAALLYELFGEAALLVASGALRGPCIVRLTRALVLGDSLWLEGEQVTQETREPIGFIVFRVRQQKGEWKIAEILPWHLEAIHYLSDRPDPKSDVAVGVFLTSYGLQLSPKAQLDKVEKLLIGTMQQEYYPLTTIARAIRLWRHFRDQGDTSGHSDTEWAAAVHRAMDRMALVEEPLEQVALLYRVETPQLANAYNVLLRHLRLTYFDPRYSPIPNPSELARQARAEGVTVSEELLSLHDQPLPEEVVEP